MHVLRTYVYSTSRYKLFISNTHTTHGRARPIVQTPTPLRSAPRKAGNSRCISMAVAKVPGCYQQWPSPRSNGGPEPEKVNRPLSQRLKDFLLLSCNKHRLSANTQLEGPLGSQGGASLTSIAREHRLQRGWGNKYQTCHSTRSCSIQEGKKYFCFASLPWYSMSRAISQWDIGMLIMLTHTYSESHRYCKSPIYRYLPEKIMGFPHLCLWFPQGSTWTVCISPRGDTRTTLHCKSREWILAVQEGSEVRGFAQTEGLEG